MKTESQNCQNKKILHVDGLESQESQRLIRSYGRIKSRKLSEHKSALLENDLANYAISTEDFSSKAHSSNHHFAEDLSSKNIPLNQRFSEDLSSGHQFAKISFEIGFGFGDFLFAKAQANPTQMFLGCEPHINGVVNLLAKLEVEPLKNIKISRDDARELLSKFDDNFFDEIYILFPDPWPKIKHFKRRLINLDLIDNLLAKKIKSGGKLIIATDHDSYKTWILSALLKSKKFSWNAASKDDWKKFPDDWIVTKYQKKAQREGRESVIFNLYKKAESSPQSN